MNSQNKIQQELAESGSRLPHEKQPVFTVPQDYFEQFAASVLQAIKSRQEGNPAPANSDELPPILASAPRQMPYQVPPEYFTQLPAGLPALVKDDVLPAVLSAASREMPYAVPSGYFEGLAAQAMAKTATPKAKVISLRTRFMRVAAAAAIAGALAVSGVLYFSRTNSVEPNLENISKSDLENFLKTIDAGSGSRELVQKGGKSEVQKMLRDVPTTELDAFLSDLPTESDFSNIN